MTKLDLARSLAKKSHRSKAKAADDVDMLVHRLLKDLKLTQKAIKRETSSVLNAPLPVTLRES
jgi:nucleoid DNA-binding protein